MSDWNDFSRTTNQVYGVDMSCLDEDYDREQREYFLFSSRWTELPPEAVLTEPSQIKYLDLSICTLQDARGISSSDKDSKFDFEVNGTEVFGPVSGFACWFTSDFRSRTDEDGKDAPRIFHPSFLSTGPENGYTHWGQQTFYLPSSIPVFKGEITRLMGGIEMTRTKENARLYNARITYSSSRRRSEESNDGPLLMKSEEKTLIYQIP